MAAAPSESAFDAMIPSLETDLAVAAGDQPAVRTLYEVDSPALRLFAFGNRMVTLGLDKPSGKRFCFYVIDNKDFTTPRLHSKAKPPGVLGLASWFCDGICESNGSIILSGTKGGDILCLVWDRDKDGEHDKDSEKIYAEVSVIELRVLDASKKVAKDLNVAKWENAFTGPTALRPDFIESGVHRFYIRVVDHSQRTKSKVSVFLRTNNKDSGYDDDQTELELTKVAGTTGTFESKSLLLVSDDIEHQCAARAR